MLVGFKRRLKNLRYTQRRFSEDGVGKQVSQVKNSVSLCPYSQGYKTLTILISIYSPKCSPLQKGIIALALSAGQYIYPSCYSEKFYFLKKKIIVWFFLPYKG